MFNESQWLDYIIKINDRHLTVKRTSGFTTWSLLGLLIFLIYSSINAIPDVFSNEYSKILFQIYTTILFNALICLFLINSIIKGFTIPENSNSYRLFSKTEKKAVPSILIPSILILISLSLINIRCIYLSEILHLKSWPYLFFAVYIFAQAFGGFLFVKSKTKQISNLESFLLAQRKTNPKVVNLIIGFLLFFLMLVSIYYLGKSNLIIGYTEIIKHAASFVGIWIVLIIIYSIKLNNLKYQSLTSLETRIITEGLKPEQIKDIFIKEYLGQNLKEWILNIQTTLKVKYDKLDVAIKQTDEKLQEVKLIDGKYKYEIAGQLTQIQSNYELAFEEYLEYVDSLIIEIQSLKKRNVFSYEEYLVLDTFLDEWRTQGSNVKTKLTNYKTIIMGILQTTHNYYSNTERA